MKFLTTTLSLAILTVSGCTKSAEPIEITVKQDGSSDFAIRITVEGKEDVVIDDPYEDKIQALSRGFADKRTNFIKNRATMSSEQRKEYGKLRDETAAQIRELDKQRRTYIRAQLEAHEGVGFILEAKDKATSSESVSNYFESLEK